MKGIFIAKRARPDIALAISVLSGRVRNPTKDNWKKLKRLCDYLEGTIKLHLVLKIDADGIPILKWYVDASFCVHEDFCLHTGGVLKPSLEGGALISGSIRQKLNTRSSTEAELVGADDFMSKIVWTGAFLKMQGIRLQRNILFQDIKSAILLETKGNSSAGKRMRHLDVQYYFIKDSLDRGDLEVQHCPTESMVANFLTKPLQCKMFLNFRTAILGPQ